MDNNYIDRLAKQALGDLEVSFQADDWALMEERLEKEKRFAPPVFLAKGLELLLMGLLLLGVIYLVNTRSGFFSENVQKPNISTVNGAQSGMLAASSNADQKAIDLEAAMSSQHKPEASMETMLEENSTETALSNFALSGTKNSAKTSDAVRGRGDFEPNNPIQSSVGVMAISESQSSERSSEWIGIGAQENESKTPVHLTKHRTSDYDQYLYHNVVPSIQPENPANFVELPAEAETASSRILEEADINTSDEGPIAARGIERVNSILELQPYGLDLINVSELDEKLSKSKLDPTPEDARRIMRVGGSISPKFHTYELGNLETPLHVTDFGYAIGGHAIFDFGSRLSLETGMQLGYMAYGIADETETIINEHPLSDNFVKQNHIVTAEIPLNMQVEISEGNNWRTYATAGASAHMVLFGKHVMRDASTSQGSVFESFKGLSSNEERPTSPADSFKANSYLSANLGIGVERKLTEEVSLFVQPTYQLGLTKFGPEADKVNSFSLLMGGRVTL